jgi:pimeloyl-ACP methyl ester carboxylesterase
MLLRIALTGSVVVTAFIAYLVLQTAEYDPNNFPDKTSDLNTTYIHYVKVHTYTTNLQVIEIGENDLNKPLLIFLHGFPETALMSWHHQLEYFASLDKYYILAPDMRGYNKSDKPKTMMEYHISYLVSDVHALIHKFAKRKDAYLVAHDWGAIVAWKFAQKFPESIKKLTVMNVPHPGAISWLLKSQKWDIIKKQAKKSWYIFFFQLPYPLPEFRFSRHDYATLKAVHIPLGRKKIISAKMLQRYVQAYSEPGAITAMMNYYRAMLTGRVITSIVRLFSDTPMVNQYIAPDDEPIKKPTMIIWGVNDLAIEFEAAKLSWEKGISEEVKSESSFVPFEDAGHFITNEKSEQVNKLLEEFLQ